MLSETPAPPLNPAPSPDPATAQLEAGLAEAARLIVAIRELRRRLAEPDTDLGTEIANVRRLFEAVAGTLAKHPPSE